MVDDIVDRFARAESGRSNWESHWEEIAERVIPSYSGIFMSRGEERTPGEKKTEFLFDSTAAIGLGRFASVVDSMLTPANQKWGRFVSSNPELQKIREVRAYFEEVTNIVHKFRYAPKANFQSQNHESFRMLGAFGTGTVFIDRLVGDPGIRYRSIHLGEIYFEENHQGIIDTAYRRFKMTARQINQKWPDNKSKKVKDAKDQDKFTILHCVKPRTDLDPTRKDYRGMAYASYYIIRDDRTLLEEGGYRTWPYPSSRYYKTPGEIYGRSPAMDVLPAIKTLNEEKKTILKQGHRTVDPVLLTHDDGIVDTFSLLPGSVNAGGVSAEGRPLVHTLPIGNVMIGKELMDDERAVINDAFLVTLFQILTENPQMTATEVIERVKKKGILLNPTVGRQQSEYLGPTGEREIDVLQAQGLLPEMPGVLIEAGGEYNLEYDSPMARSARAEEAAGAMRSIEMTLGIVNATQDPSPLDNYDFDIIIPEVSEIQGTPLRWMKDPRAIQAIREARAKQAEQQQMIEAAPAMAGMMKNMNA